MIGKSGNTGELKKLGHECVYYMACSSVRGHLRGIKPALARSDWLPERARWNYLTQATQGAP